MSETSDRDRSVRPEIHLCKGCRVPVDDKPGRKLVVLSDGYNDEDGVFRAENHRVWHRDCFEEERPLHTGSDHSGDGGEEACR